MLGPEPRVREHFLGTRDVLLLELDLHVLRQLELLEVTRAEPQKTRLGNGHSHRFVGKPYRALLHDAVDVKAPRIVVDQHVERKLELVVHSLQKPPYSTR